MSATALKLIGLVCMTIDHICVFVPGIPIWFRWIGRIASMLFSFCAVESAVLTHDRRAYCKRLWKMSVGMELANCTITLVLREMFPDRSIEGVGHNIFTSILFGVWLISILEDTKTDMAIRKKRLLRFCLYQIGGTALLAAILLIFPTMPSLLEALILSIAACSVLMITTEGPLVLTLVMLLFYFCRGNKKRLSIAFSAYCLLYGLVFVMDVPQRFHTALSWRIGTSLTDLLCLPLNVITHPKGRPFTIDEFPRNSAVIRDSCCRQAEH